jgi:hypothetical protein
MKRLIIRDHAKDRIRQRFNVKAGEERAFVERHFPKADRVCSVKNNRGNLTAHYITGDVIFVIDEQIGELITLKNRVSKKARPSSESFRSKVRSFIRSEIENITAIGAEFERQADDLEQAIREELSELQTQLKRTRSLAKKLAIKGRIMALDERFEELPTDIREIRSNIRKQINGALAHY